MESQNRESLLGENAFEVNGDTFRGNDLANFFFASLLSGGQFLKEIIFSSLAANSFMLLGKKIISFQIASKNTNRAWLFETNEAVS